MKRFLFAIATMSLVAHAWGLNLEPLSQEFDPAGRGAIRTFRVTNTQEQRIAVKLSVTTRSVTPDGREIREPAEDAFTLFPQRLLLAPGQSQAVRVQWRGPSSLGRERAYRLIVEQVPVEGRTPAEAEEEAEQGGDRVALSFIYKYEGAMYVTPPDAEPDIQLVDARPRPDGKLALHFENRGTRHAVVSAARVVLRSSGPGAGEGESEDSSREEPREHVLGSEDLEVISGANFLAGTTLIEVVDLPEGMSASTTDVDYELETAN